MTTASGAPVPPPNHGEQAVIRVVAAALVDDLYAPRRLLAARRTEPAFLAGGWELPGGKVDPGESDEQALVRELGEELGVTVQLGAAVPGPDVGGSWPVAGPYRLWVRWARVLEGDPQPLEGHDLLRWLDWPAWDGVAWLPTNVPIVAALGAVAARVSRTVDDAPRGTPSGT